MPLSWGRRYCVYKYQGFLFYIVTLVLSNVHAFRIGSFLFLPRFSSIPPVPIISNLLAGISIRIKSSFSTKAIVPPRRLPGIHARSLGLG